MTNGARALRAGSRAYFALSVSGGVIATYIALTQSPGFDVSEALSTFFSAFVPFVVAMGLRRGERWSRWLGVRLGLGLCVASALEIAARIRDLATDSTGAPTPHVVRMVGFAIAGVIAGYAASRLASPEARAVMTQPDDLPPPR